VVHIVAERDGAAALREGFGLVVGRVGDDAAEPVGLVAVGVVAEGGIDRIAADAQNAVRPRLAGGRIGVIADTGLAGEVTDRIVPEGLRQADAKGGGRQPIERIVGLAQRTRSTNPGHRRSGTVDDPAAAKARMVAPMALLIVPLRTPPRRFSVDSRFAATQPGPAT